MPLNQPAKLSPLYFWINQLNQLRYTYFWINQLNQLHYTSDRIILHSEPIGEFVYFLPQYKRIW